MYLTIIVILYVLNFSKALEDCTAYNLTNWNCDDYNYYFNPKKVETTLRCIGYRKYIYPGNPMEIKIRREIRQMIKIDENERNVVFEEKIKVDFHDHRLHFEFCNDVETDKLHFYNDLTSLFWKPDFDTPRETLFKPSFDRVLIYNRGDIKLSNVDLKSFVRCHMDYTWYPFDVQICPHPFLVDEDPKVMKIKYDHEQVFEDSSVEKFEDPDWKISLYPGDCKEHIKEQCFSVDLIFERKIATHILHEYVPSLMLSIASTASLFIPSENMPARMSLAVTSCLSMITLFVNAK